MYPDLQKDLGFSWFFNDTPRYITFSLLLFGLSTACFLVMRPLVKGWRLMEQVCFVYLDNGFARQPERLSELAASSTLEQDLKSCCGLLRNEDKSHWTLMHVANGYNLS